MEKPPKNRALLEALGHDILGSLHDDDLCETQLEYVRDLKREKTGIREIEIAAALRKADDEALAMADFVIKFSGFEGLSGVTGRTCTPGARIRQPQIDEAIIARSGAAREVPKN